MVGEVFAGLQGFKALLSGLDALISIRDDVRRNMAIIDLTHQVIQLQREAIEADQAKAALTQEKRALEAKIVQMEKASGDLERYELKDVAGGATAYMLKPDGRGAEAPHWLCPTCYAQGKKSPFQPVGHTGRGEMWRCMGCRSQFVTRDRPHWL